MTRRVPKTSALYWICQAAGWGGFLSYVLGAYLIFSPCHELGAIVSIIVFCTVVPIAMTHAARESLRLLGAAPASPRRRVVLAAEVGSEQVTTSAGFEEPALVHVEGPIRLRDIVSGHVDDAGADHVIAAAVAALAAADAGDDDARFAVDGAEGYELQWYATQELEDLAGYGE